MSKEVWKPIVGWEGVYEVSSLGAVRRIKQHRQNRHANEPFPRLLMQCGNGNGYLMVNLCDAPRKENSTKVHQLVALAFIGPRPDGHQVNHIDRNRANNAASNLEYVTPSENTIHGYKSAERRAAVPRGEKHGMCKLTENKVRAIRIALRQGARLTQLGRLYGVTPQLIFRIRAGKIWKHVI